ncbi:hypothetical protein H0O00_05285 [Candidatus Micrarchaeota archaeon]|nr:hypothetical protein [Candidatus Micrarchaeota archaeon]
MLASALPFILAFLAGFLVKAVDWMDDDRKSKHPSKYVFAAAYGLAIGYLIGTASFSVLFLAALVAQVFARKIDTVAHQLGFAIAAISLFAFGFPSLDVMVFVFFVALAFLDELKLVGALKPLTDYRMFLKLGALVMVAFGRWDYLVAILLFDGAYMLFGLLGKYIK